MNHTCPACDATVTSPASLDDLLACLAAALEEIRTTPQKVETDTS